MSKTHLYSAIRGANPVEQIRESKHAGVSAVHLRPLQNVLNSAALIILRKQRLDHITADIRDLLHWLPVQQRLEYKMCVLVYKCLHQSAPIYLSELCIPVAATASPSHLHLAVQDNLVNSYYRTKRLRDRLGCKVSLREHKCSIHRFTANIHTRLP